MTFYVMLCRVSLMNKKCFSVPPKYPEDSIGNVPCAVVGEILLTEGLLL